MRIVSPGVVVSDRPPRSASGYLRLATGRLAGRAIALGWACTALPVVAGTADAPAGTRGLILAAFGIVIGVHCAQRRWDAQSPAALHVLLAAATLQACAALIALDTRVLASISFFAAVAFVAGLGLRGRAALGQVALCAATLIASAALAPNAADGAVGHALLGAIAVVGLGVLPGLVRGQRAATARRLAAMPSVIEMDAASFARLHERLAESVAADPERFALLAMDIDSLRAMNGAAVGGASLLDEVAQALADSVGGTGAIVSRTPDAFAVLAPGADKDGAALLAHRIEAALQRIESLQRDPVAPAIGIAVFPEDGRTPEALIATAGEDLDRAKRVRREALAPVRATSAA